MPVPWGTNDFTKRASLNSAHAKMPLDQNCSKHVTGPGCCLSWKWEMIFGGGTSCHIHGSSEVGLPRSNSREFESNSPWSFFLNSLSILGWQQMCVCIYIAAWPSDVWRTTFINGVFPHTNLRAAAGSRCWKWAHAQNGVDAAKLFSGLGLP